MTCFIAFSDARMIKLDCAIMIIKAIIVKYCLKVANHLYLSLIKVLEI